MDSSNGVGRAFIGSFTSGGGRGVTAVAVDQETGALTVLGATDAVPDPSYLALGRGSGPGGAVLYAVSETEQGAAAALDISHDVPRPIGAARPVNGDSPTHLALAGGHLITANYGSGSVTVLPVLADGSIGAACSVLQHEGSGPDTGRQQGPHAHQVLPDPSGNWVLSVDLGTDSVRICALDPDTGALRLHGETLLRPGSGPRHLAFHPEGAHAYVLNELEPTLTVCRWDAAAGVLETVDETSVLPVEATGDTAAASYPSEVVVSHDGRFLWVANRGHDSISVLTLDATGEKASLVTTVSCGGHWPRDLALDPTGRRLYAANERSGNVAWFTVDPETGIPSQEGSLEAPAASCVIFA
ncbi:6-phosphogluconolactonase (cycloisomerase 2 family) [Streptomyces brevispora]|uniref:6-phosphogluconolactonase (Cycloisomerase 2 family) n=1 Tax=Streptomyces brevispora TaxID=887462 RepID=A0A561TXJ4_9ACTN|nr:lactonase family protein [Streptomyces brevispora]TWF91804.1 6-phosphogluconolactonase (cycloisomerase 2 family) [Streptomyces brevispora]